MPDPNLTKRIRKTMIESVQAAAGTKIFQHMYVRDKTSGREFDTMRDGELACAFFVSGMLCLLGLIDRSHSTITTTLEKMKEAGWYEIDEPVAGAVVYWPKYEGQDHLGFYLGGVRYISNSLTQRVPIEHGEKLADGREPDAYYWHEVLNQD